MPRINNIIPQADYKLLISFDSGESVLYDVNDDINHIDDFSILRTEEGLFENVRLDESRTCVYWSERVDLPSDTLLEYGQRV